VQALRTDPPPLNDELAQVSDTYAQRYRVGVDYDTSGSPVPLPPDASLALLRVAQEALVNAAKHAPHQAVAIRLDYGDDDVRLTVRNGLPSSVATPGALRTVNGGYGLTGMRERLRLLSGSLDAGRRDDEWVVTAELPRPAPESMTS
jgi:signal transduction histidine kinase